MKLKKGDQLIFKRNYSINLAKDKEYTIKHFIPFKFNNKKVKQIDYSDIKKYWIVFEEDHLNKYYHHDFELGLNLQRKLKLDEIFKK